MANNEKSKDRLNQELTDEITKLFEQALDYAQIACPEPNTYKNLRSRILRIGNNCIRNVSKRLQHYNVEFVPQAEDVIEIKKPRVVKKGQV